MSQQATAEESDVLVIAADPQAMAQSQLQTIEAVKHKVLLARKDLVDAEELIAAAKMANVDDEAARKLRLNAERRITFLEKVQLALEAGYVLMPEMPGDIIAVRVDRDHSRVADSKSTYSAQHARANLADEKADELPAGVGKYVDVRPNLNNTSFLKPSSNPGEAITVYQAATTTVNDEIGLPVAFMKPEVIKRTGKALEHKIFDELRIVPGRRPRADPLVIGTVLMGGPFSQYRSRRRLHFLVAWFFDTKDI